MAAADWIRDWAPWDTWATLTFERPASFEQCEADRRKFLRFVARDVARDHVRVFWAMGPQSNGRPHYHMLLAAPAGMHGSQRRALETGWSCTSSRTGFARVVQLTDPGNRAHYAVRRHAHWDITAACPRPPRCRRRRGCLQAPGPW